MQSNESFRLVVRRGPQPNQTFELNKDIITLGRDITNDIVINDPEVSRHHLRLTRGASGYNIEDLGSTNGTFIGGQRITGVRPLNRGDMIGLGETVTLSYEVAQPGAEGAPASPPPQQAYTPPQQEAQESSPPAQQSPPPQDEAAQQGYTPPPQQGGYAQQPPPAYDQQQPQYGAGYQPPPQQPDYGYQQQSGAGYDYDPYAVREEEGAGMGRWLMIGCGLLSLFCCCSTIVGVVIIDALSLWYDLPIIRDIAPLFESIANALGLV